MKKLFTMLTVVMVAMLISTTAFAATQNTNSNTVAPTLQISATVQKAIRLTLSTGAAAGSCVISAGGGDYQMSFGTVDALAINNGSCGSKIAPTTPGTSNAIYWTAYQMTPVFTSQASNAASTITAQVTTDFAGGASQNLFVMRDAANSAAVPAVAADFTNMGTGSADTIVGPAALANNTAITRYIGLGVSPVTGGSLAAQTATVTFTLTIN